MQRARGVPGWAHQRKAPVLVARPESKPRPAAASESGCKSLAANQNKKRWFVAVQILAAKKRAAPVCRSSVSCGGRALVASGRPFGPRAAFRAARGGCPLAPASCGPQNQPRCGRGPSLAGSPRGMVSPGLVLLASRSPRSPASKARAPRAGKRHALRAPEKSTRSARRKKARAPRAGKRHALRAPETALPAARRPRAISRPPQFGVLEIASCGPVSERARPEKISALGGEIFSGRSRRSEPRARSGASGARARGKAGTACRILNH